ncbi:MAG TPA: hydroxysqualene dehydroxylase HpnE [Blastocatellia bacterium]|nr:hydroxysqualene dehydroxylase HpnE [Blastocatellia bacterium]
MSKRVVIIGGGFSGLAAGVALSERGHHVHLFERRNHLGGRAYSFTDPKSGDQVDNGQHLFMRCYSNTVAFLDKIGCLDKLQFQDKTQIEFLDREGRDRFECPSLPAPLHVLAGLLRMKGLTLQDKARLLRLGSALRNGSGGDLTVTRWLESLGQSENIRRRFWTPLVVATLNESPDTASARMLKVVLREAFDGGRWASNIGISRVGLSELYTEGARTFIEAHGGRISTGSQIARLHIKDGLSRAVDLKDGDEIEGDFFISAVTPEAFLQILPGDLRDREFSQLAQLESSPIVSINLWFDRPVTDRAFIGLLGTRIQWLFNKDAILRRGGNSNQIALIISAARGFVNWTRETLVEMAITELNQLLPETRSARLVHSVIVKERDATISHSVESDKLRPAAGTSISNLILAGDWTNTGLPATIESAVLSGNLAANLVE